MIPLAEKVVAYIVRGDTLAVFLHEDDANPVRESGLQVPAGTREAGETPEQAVLREAHEEAGLMGLEIVRYLGDADYDMRPYAEVVHHRHFFHLAVAGPVVDEWRHVERDGGTGPDPFSSLGCRSLRRTFLLPDSEPCSAGSTPRSPELSMRHH